MALVVLLGMAGPSIAYAHANLVRSDPPADVVLPQPPHLVHLWFTEDVNGGASRIIVWDRYRHVENVGHASLVRGESRELEVGLKPLKPGSYLVLWTSVSAQDGHVLHGFYLFSVETRGPGPSLAGVHLGGTGQSFPDASTLASLLAHWIELLGAVVWIGAAGVSILAFLPALRRGDRHERVLLGRLLTIALLALFCAATVVIALDAYNVAGGSWGDVISGDTLSSVFSAQYGRLWIVRQLLVVFTLLLTAGVRPRRISHRSMPLASGYAVASCFLLGLLYLYVFAASGHAASVAIGDVEGSHLISASVGIDWLHLVGDALWFGGQIYIVLVLIPALGLWEDGQGGVRIFLRALDRFSPIAYASIVFFAVSGVFNADVHIRSWYAYFHSVYGWTLTVKIVLIGLMMLTSAVTVYILRPRLRQALDDTDSSLLSRRQGLLRGLLVGLRVNPVLGVAVLLATSVLFYYPVPPGLSPAGPAVYTAHGGGYTATLTLSPGRSGLNDLTILLHGREGQLIQQAHVTILTTMLDMVMGSGLAQLTEKAPGRFTGSTDLAMGGHWRLLLLVYTPSSFTRIPIQVRVGT